MSSSPPTIRLKDVAERAGVAVSTVSMALQDHPAISDDTKERIRLVSKEIGYKAPRRSERAPATPDVAIRRLGFIVLGARSDDEGYSQLAFELADAAQSVGCRLEISSIFDVVDAESVFAQIQEAGRGVAVLMICGRLTAAVARLLLAADIRFMVVGNILGGPETAELRRQISVVTFDDMEMGRGATQYLLSRGHRRIAFACGSIYPGLMHDRCRSGYRMAMLDHGLSLDPTLEFVDASRDPDSADAGPYFRGMAEPPTAYLVPNARIAAALLADLSAHGVAPSPDDWAICDSSDRAAHYGMGAYPLVRGSSRALARHSIHLVGAVAAGESAVSVTVPFDLLNANMEGSL